MVRVVFGDDEPRSLRTIMVDLVSEHLVDGKSEKEARTLATNDIVTAYESNEPWATAAIMTALDVALYRAMRGRYHNGTKFIPKPGSKATRGSVRGEYAVDRQLRLPIMAMTFTEARIAIVNQKKKAAEIDARAARFEELVEGLALLVPNALTLGDAAERCGQTAELIDLSDLLDA